MQRVGPLDFCGRFWACGVHDDAITEIHGVTPLEAAGVDGRGGACTAAVGSLLVRDSGGRDMSGPLDQLDTTVYRETVNVRRQYVQACQRLGLTPRALTAVTLGMRSVR